MLEHTKSYFSEIEMFELEKASWNGKVQNNLKLKLFIDIFLVITTERLTCKELYLIC